MPATKDTEIAKQVGAAIKGARTSRGITIEQVAERVDVAPVRVARWEAGDRSPNITTLIRLARVLGVPAGDLLGDGDAREPDWPPEVAELLRLLGEMNEERRSIAVRVIREIGR